MNIKDFLFSKEYGSLHWKISYFFKCKIPFTKIWNEYNNPYFPWWKARKYFKRPKWKTVICGKISWFFGLPIRHDYYNRILDIRLSALGWKSKYDSPRHEWNPYIAITLFRKWQIVWMLVYGDKNDPHYLTKNEATWEAMLDYLYFNIPIDEVVDNNIWKSGEDPEPITIKENMK